jgi:hypothetical protein
MATTAANNNRMIAGARKKLQFRDTRLGVMPNTIDAFSRLTVDAATKAALTQAGAKLTVEIDTAGTRVFLADQRTGSLIGGPEDLNRLGGIRAFVNRERKDVQGIQAAKEVTQLAFKAHLLMASNVQEYKAVPLEPSYGAAVRPLLSVVNTINDNMKKLEENTNPSLREVFEPQLKTFFTKLRNAHYRLILLHTAGQSTKGELNKLLFSAGVPEYVTSRLTNRSLVLDRSQELARVLFPSDPSKGLSLTLKEWRSEEFREKVGSSLLGASRLVVELANNDKFIRVISKIDDSISLDDETNPSVAKLLKCRIGVIPPMRDCRYVIDPASKTRAGWKFPSPSMDSIAGSISALSTALLRMYSANMQSVDLVGDFYATIVPGAVSRAAVSPTNNFYVQWGKAKDPNGIWLDHVLGGSTGTHRQNVWRWLRTEMRLSEKAEGGKALASALLLNEDGSPSSERQTITRRVSFVDPAEPNVKKHRDEEQKIYPVLEVPAVNPTVSKPTDGKLNLQRELTAEEIPLWQKFQKEVFPSKKKGKKVVATLGNTLTRLTPEGKALVEEISGLSPDLADRMRQWLRGFADERVQRAAVKLANASFDELFIEESKDSDVESDSDESDEED